jgi:hypothetical protein
MALVPTSDPMTQVGGRSSVAKTNLYRMGVDQPALPAGQTPGAYCAGLQGADPAGPAATIPLLQGAAAPAGAPGTLYDFLATRHQATLQALGCAAGEGNPGHAHEGRR